MFIGLSIAIALHQFPGGSSANFVLYNGIVAETWDIGDGTILEMIA